MAEFLSQYSIQRWMEMCPQGYLEDTVYGHDSGATEPESLLADDDEREAAIRTTVSLVVGERCAVGGVIGPGQRRAGLPEQALSRHPDPR